MTFREENIVFAVCVIAVLCAFGLAWGVLMLMKAMAFGILVPGVL